MANSDSTNSDTLAARMERARNAVDREEGAGLDPPPTEGWLVADATLLLAEQIGALRGELLFALGEVTGAIDRLTNATKNHAGASQTKGEQRSRGAPEVVQQTNK